MLFQSLSSMCMCRKEDTVLIVRVRVQNYHMYAATVTNICVRCHGVIESSFGEVKRDPCLITVIYTLP